MKRIFVSTAVVLLIVGLSGCSMLGKKAEAIPSHDDLKKEYKSSKDSFSAKYNGKEISVWGKVKTINPSAEQTYLRMETTNSDLNGTPDIICSVAKADTNKFEQMKVENGTYVRVKGTISIDEKDLYPIQLKSCKLETIGISNVMSDSD